MDYLKNIHLKDTGNQTIKIGKSFVFHYHINENDEWYYFDVSIINDVDFDLDDFLNNKIKYRIEMNPSTKVIDEKIIIQLNSGFQV